VNNLTIVGNMVAQPEVRFTPSGVAQATFRVGVNRRFQSAGEWKSEGTFFTCVAWAELAEAVADVNKGDRVIVVGRMACREFESNGEKRKVWEIAVEDLGHSLKPLKSAKAPEQARVVESEAEQPF
jgi:single-strand DNA-binding protein